MSFLKSLNVAGSALTAQRFRMDIITQNLANLDTTAPTEEEAYRRKMVVFQEQKLSFDDVLNNTQNGGVKAVQVIESDAELRKVYDPDSPLAGEDGYIIYSNVDSAEEQVDLMAASNAYEANITALSIVKAMAMRALDIGK